MTRNGAAGGAGRGPGGRRPGRPGAPRTRTTGEQPAVPRASAGTPRRRPRLTGRAAVLLVVVAVLMMSYASSLRAFLQQRDHILDLKTEIAEREAAIADLEQEKRRWDDPGYTRQQARERFGFVMPGERSYTVVDENGDPVSGSATLDDPDDVARPAPVPWWDSAWASVRLAGNPPRELPPEETVPLDIIRDDQ